MDEKKAYELGRDCKRYDASRENCDYSIFSSHKFKEAWQKGYNEPVEQSQEASDGN